MEGHCCLQDQWSFIACKLCLSKRTSYLLTTAEGNPVKLYQLLLPNFVLAKICFNPCQAFSTAHSAVQPSRYARILMTRSGTDVQMWWLLTAANEASKISSAISPKFLRLSRQDEWVLSTFCLWTINCKHGLKWLPDSSALSSCPALLYIALFHFPHSVPSHSPRLIPSIVWPLNRSLHFIDWIWVFSDDSSRFWANVPPPQIFSPYTHVTGMLNAPGGLFLDLLLLVSGPLLTQTALR